MKSTLILGIAPNLIGAVILACGQFRYRPRETGLKFGPINATAETTKTVPMPPILGWTLIGGCAVAPAFCARLKT